MALTIAELNEKLVQQNSEQTEVLVDIKSNLGKLNSRMGQFAERFKSDRLRDAEKQREADREEKTKIISSKNKDNSETKKPFFDLPEGGIFGIGRALVAGLPGFLLGRALPAFLAKAFADEIADYVESATGSKDLGDAIYRGLNLGALGLLVSKKLGLIGFFTGALLDDQNQRKLDELGNQLKELGRQIDVDLPTFAELLSGVTRMFGDGISFITAGVGVLNGLIKGDLTEEEKKKFKKDLETLDENKEEALGSVALLAAMLRPGGTIGLIFKAISAPFRAVGTAISSLAATLTGTSAAKTAEDEKGRKKLTKGEMKAANIEDAKKLNKKQIADLKKAGISVDPDGQMKNAKGQYISAQAGREALNKVGVENPLNKKASSKFKNFGKLLTYGKGIPFLGALIQGGLLASVLLGEGSEENKVAAIARIFGGAAGAYAIGSLGFAIGGPIGGILGSIAGMTLGEGLGERFGNWLLGKDEDEGGILGNEPSRRNTRGQRASKDLRSNPLFRDLEFDYGDTGETISATPMRSNSATTLQELNGAGTIASADTGFRFFNSQQDNSVNISNPTEVVGGRTGSAHDWAASRYLSYT